MNQIASFAVPVILLPLMGGAVGFVTQPGIDGWYQLAAKSVLTPPDWVFGAVWPALYVMMGVSLGLLLRLAPETPEKTPLLRLFILQLALNLVWSIVFFQMQALWLATVWVLALGGLVVFLIIKTWAVQRIAAGLLVPYALWLGFAFYLSLCVALFNR